VPAILAEDAGAHSGNPRRVDCFAGVSANDIVDPITLQKVCGCAMRRTRTAILVQASIPAGDPLAPPSSVIQGGVWIKPAELNRARFAAELRIVLNRFSNSE